MSIENNIERIAVALEQIQKTLQQNINPVFATQPVAPAPHVNMGPTPTVAPEPAPKPPTPEPAAATPAPPAAPAPVANTPPPPPAAAAPEQVILTPELLNEACKQKATQLGGPDKIRELFSVYGVSGVASLDPSAYNEFKQQLDALK